MDTLRIRGEGNVMDQAVSTFLFSFLSRLTHAIKCQTFNAAPMFLFRQNCNQGDHENTLSQKALPNERVGTTFAKRTEKDDRTDEILFFLGGTIG